MPDKLHLPFRPCQNIPLPVKNLAAAAWNFQGGGDAKAIENFFSFMSFYNSGRTEADGEKDGHHAEDGRDDFQLSVKLRKSMQAFLTVHLFHHPILLGDRG